MGSPVWNIGVDDGHSETKLILPNGRKLRIPSQAKSGQVNVISIDNSEPSVFVYKTDEGLFSLGKIPRHEPTNFDDYPKSALNRAIVTHALIQAGVPAGAEINICTGLPLKKYFLGGKPNKKLIKEKMANLSKNDVEPIKGGEAPKIAKNRVFSEGVGAWLDYVMVRDEKGRLDIDPEMLEKRIAVIDFGGRTLDVAVVKNWELDKDRSDTIDVGMLSIRQLIMEAIYDEHEVELTEEQITEVLRDGTFKMYGKKVSAQALVESAEREAVSRAKVQVMKLLGKAADIDEVIFVGGTSAYLEKYLEGWFPHQTLAKDPAFANARGFQKFMESMAV